MGTSDLGKNSAYGKNVQWKKLGMKKKCLRGKKWLQKNVQGKEGRRNSLGKLLGKNYPGKNVICSFVNLGR